MDLVTVPASPFTDLERFSFTAKCTKKMMQWDHSEKHRLFWQFAARVLGCALVILAIVADFFMHFLLALGKGVVVGPVQPFKLCFAEKISRDLDVSSPVIHFMFAIEIGTKKSVIPFIILFSPDRAYRAAQTGGVEFEELEYYKNKVKDLEQRQGKIQIEEAKYRQELHEVRIEIAKLQKENKEKLEKAALSDQTIKNLEEKLRAAKLKDDANALMLKQNLEKLRDPDVKPFHLFTPDAKDFQNVAQNRHKELQNEVSQPLDQEPKRNFVKNLLQEFEAAEKKNNAEELKDLVLEKQHISQLPSPIKPAVPPSPSKESLVFQGGGGRIMIPPHMDDKVVEAKGNMLQDMLKVGTSRLKPATNIGTHKKKIDLIRHSLAFPVYCKFVDIMILYLEGFLGKKSPIKMDYGEIHGFTEQARKEIRELNYENSTEIATQKLRTYQAIQEYIAPLLIEYKKNIQANAKAREEKSVDNVQDPLKAERAKNAEKRSKKLQLLSSITFVNVQKIASLEENIDKTNKIIKEAVNGKETTIQDFKTLLNKIQDLKNQINQKQAFRLDDVTDNYKLVVEIVKMINGAYSLVNLNDRNKSNSINKNLALKALNFVNVEEDAADFNIHQTNELIKAQGKNIVKDFNEFKIQLNEMRQSIEQDQAINEKKFAIYQNLVARLNEGAYLPRRANSQYFKN